MASKTKIIALLVKWSSPPLDESRDELRYWQERILYSFLLISLVLGLIALIPSVLLSIKEGLWLVAVIDVLIYLWAIVIFCYRRLSYNIRVLSIVLISYGLGLLLLVVVGPFGGGPVWLFFFPIVTGLLTNLRFAIISQLVNFVTLLVFGLLIFYSHYHWPFLKVHPLESWVVMSLNFLLLNAIATLSVAIVNQGLQNSLSEKKAALDSLEVNNAELRFTNQWLVDEIKLKKQAKLNLQHSENALKESEIRFKELVNVLPLGYFLLSSDFEMRFINQKAIGTFGFSEHLLDTEIQADSMTMLAIKDRQPVLDNLTQVLNGNHIGWGRYTVSLGNGDIPVEIYACAIINESEVVGVHGLIVDVTDRLEMEKLRTAKEIAEKTNQSISEWVSFIAHEIRTPLSGLLSFSQMGIDKLSSNTSIPSTSDVEALINLSPDSNSSIPETVRRAFAKLKLNIDKNNGKFKKYFDRIHTSSSRLNTLLNELLDLSKLESGRMTFSFQKASLYDIVQDAMHDFKAAILEKGLVLKINEPGLSTDVECDSFRIGQLVRNLLSNAIKFSEEGKSIRISFSSDLIKRGRRSIDNEVPAVKTMFMDQGIGIPVSELNEVFEKFKQSRKSRVGEGTGLGLSICKEIVVAHDGIIKVESEENKGSCFYFTLPNHKHRQQ